MRLTKDITIREDGNDFKFRLKQLSAYDMQRWGFKVGAAFAESGLFTVPGKLLIDFSIDKLLKAIAEKGTAFLQNLDPEKANGLISELVFKTTSRVNGQAITPLNEEELESIFFDLRSLVQLEKEVLIINFQKYLGDIMLNSHISPQTENPTSNRGISVEELPN